jgi:hypothetical protein
MDDDKSGKLDYHEFSKAMKELRMGLQETDLQKLFKLFDLNKDEEISYPEFLRMVCGEMNEFRRQIVDQAFNKLDRNKDGVVTIDDLKDWYNASRHPDVITKRKTESEILDEFLDTFEQHHSILVRVRVKSSIQEDRIAK